ncbi:MAG: YihY/virulence factor BrkB family protein [Clostridia bacterium]|nr:YihY/virulence factor BrkB family protein [Clostridia bacterium]
MQKTTKNEFLRLLKEKRVTTVAGAWVYFFLSSLIPLVFLMITAFGVFGVEITSDLVSRLPEGFREAGEIIVQTANSAQEGVTIFFAGTLIFSSSALLHQMRKDGNSIYGVKVGSRRGFFNRIWAILALMVLFVIFLGTALLIAFGEKLLLNFPSGKSKRMVVSLLFGVLITLISYLVIVLLNKYVCPSKTPTSAVCSGSLISLAIIYIGTIVLGLYLNFFGLNNAFYGSLAGIVAFLLWSYILMTGLVIGTIFGYYLSKKNQAKQTLLKKQVAVYD